MTLGVPELVGMSGKTSKNTQYLKALDNIVQEYNKKISDLARLTAELPVRLLTLEELNSIDSSPRPGLFCSGPSNKVSEDLFLPGNDEKPLAPVVDDDEHLPEERQSLEKAASKQVSITEIMTHFRAGQSKRATNATHNRLTKLCPFIMRPHGWFERIRTERRVHASERSVGKFDNYVAWLILANCVAMIVQSEYIGYGNEIALGEISDTGKWRNAEMTFELIEHFFNALFVLELPTRFYLVGIEMFFDKASIFDIVLIGSSSLQLYVLEPIGLDKYNFGFFRLLRFVKVLRAFRMARVLQLFSSLRILVKTVSASMAALATSMLLLFLIMVMGGLFLSALLEEFIRNEDKDLLRRKWVSNYYGTAARATYTLFEVTLAGCWPTYFRPLIEDVSGYYVLFVVLYISFVVFAIIRIITALFLKETLQVASNDADMMVQERLKQKEVYINKLEAVFKAVDTSADGKLHLEEFLKIVSSPSVKTWLQVLDLEVHDAKALFHLLDDGDGEVTYDEFLKGVLRLKGQARSMDIITILRANESLLKGLDTLKKQMDQLHTRLP